MPGLLPWALLGCLLWFSLGCYHNLELTASLSGFYGLKEPVTREQINAFWEACEPEAGPVTEELTLFASFPDTLVENPDLNRRASVELIAAAGDMNLIFPDALMLGSLPYAGDSFGCAVSRKTAETLYSSREPIGETLYYGDTPYIIRGILELDRELCLIQGPPGQAYPNLLALAPGLPLSVVSQKLTALLSEEQTAILEGSLLYGLGSIFLWFPCWILLYFLVRTVKRGSRSLQKRLPQTPWALVLRELLRDLPLILGFAGACMILLACLHFSDDYIPTAWSDFSFWTGLVTQKTEQLLSLIKTPLSFRDLKILGSLLGLLISSILQCLLLLCSGAAGGGGIHAKSLSSPLSFV